MSVCQPPLPLSTKPDFAEAADRFEAWWRHEPADRALVSFRVAPERDPALPPATHASHRERFLDADYQLEFAARDIEARPWLAESLPLYNPDLGPVLLASLFGSELDFQATTSWAEPILHDPPCWDKVAARGADFGSFYWQHMEQATATALERARGRFLVTITDLHGAYDTLAGLRGSEELCLDLLDCPEEVLPAAAVAARTFGEAFHRLYGLLAAAGQGSTSWIPFHHAGPAYVASCDFWCLISREMAEACVDATLVTEMAALERRIFHLDGPGALQHLPWLLARPELEAVQWVYGAGNGPAARWLEVYRRILDAGKSIQVLAETPGDALEVLRACGSRGVWLHLGHEFATRREGEAFVREIERLSA